MSKTTNITAQLKQHAKEVARLEKQLVRFQAKLLKVPAKYGFGSVEDFVAALLDAAKGSGGAARKAGTRTRAKITPEVKDKVKALVKEGKTGAAIAKEVGISVPSVQNIKKELGLVKKK